MRILILEPYFTGSHAVWAEDYKRYSKHDIQILSMSGRYWKWRMHGGAVTLAREFLKSDLSPDLILATDMLDLTTFLALTRLKTTAIPCAIYFHENQLTYPWSPEDRDVVQNRDRHYGFINYTSALSSTAVFFNSQYHMESFLSELKLFLKNFPDFNEIKTVEDIRAKSSVLPLGLDLKKLDMNAPKPEDTATDDRPPLILWNHRWEYDKNPHDFFRALYALADRGLNFKVAVLGENFRNQPDEFLNAKKRLGKRIKQFGFVCDMSTYIEWLWKADIIPVTSNQDFFGASLVEAMYCNCFPILPRRLAYPELIPARLHQNIFYENFDDLLNRLETGILNIDDIRKQSMRALAKKFAWDKLTLIYDIELQKVAQNRRRSFSKKGK